VRGALATGFAQGRLHGLQLLGPGDVQHLHPRRGEVRRRGGDGLVYGAGALRAAGDQQHRAVGQAEVGAGLLAGRRPVQPRDGLPQRDAEDLRAGQPAAGDGRGDVRGQPRTTRLARPRGGRSPHARPLGSPGAGQPGRPAAPRTRRSPPRRRPHPVQVRPGLPTAPASRAGSRSRSRVGGGAAARAGSRPARSRGPAPAGPPARGGARARSPVAGSRRTSASASASAGST
jgi:hypothetical protein